MNAGRTVFAQLIAFLSHIEFQKCVALYNGDRYQRRLSCWDQYLAMAFAQLTYCESLRDLEACLQYMGSKLYHAGFRSRIARSTLADVNETHDWRIFADFAKVLIAIAWPPSAYMASNSGDINSIISSVMPRRCISRDSIQCAVRCALGFRRALDSLGLDRGNLLPANQSPALKNLRDAQRQQSGKHYSRPDSHKAHCAEQPLVSEHIQREVHNQQIRPRAQSAATMNTSVRLNRFSGQ